MILCSDALKRIGDVTATVTLRDRRSYDPAMLSFEGTANQSSIFATFISTSLTISELLRANA